MAIAKSLNLLIQASALKNDEKVGIINLFEKTAGLEMSETKVFALIQASAMSLRKSLESKELGDVRSIMRRFRQLMKSAVTGEETKKQMCYLVINAATLDVNIVSQIEQQTSRKIDELMTSDQTKLHLHVNGIELEITPAVLFRDVSYRYFGLSAPLLGRRYLELRKSQLTHEKAKAKVSAEQGNKLSAIPAEPKYLSKVVIDQIEKVLGPIEKVSTGSEKTFCVNINEKKFEDCAQNLFARVKLKLELIGVSAARSYLLLRKQNVSHAEALSQVQASSNEKVRTLSKQRIPVKPETFSQNFVNQMETCFKKALSEFSGADIQKIEFEIGGVRYSESVANLLERIAHTFFDSRSKPIARGYLQARKNGQTHESALAKAQDKNQGEVEKKPSAELIPITPDSFMPETIGQIEKVFKRAVGLIPIKDISEFIVLIRGKKYSERMHNLLRKIAFAFFDSREAIPEARRYLALRRQGADHKEAVVAAHQADDLKSDNEFAELSNLNIEEAIALLQNDSFKLKLYLQFAHPELSETEIDRLVIRSFKGLVTGPNETRENKYLGWHEQLDVTELPEQLPEETTDTTVTVSGRAKDADCIYISGTWNRRVRVESDGTFSVSVPLKVAQENAVRVMALNRDREVRSSQQVFIIDQQGDSDDVAALIELLSQLQRELIEGIRKDPGRLKFFVACIEKVLIKKFGRSFEDGELYMQELIGSTKSPVVKKVLLGILKNFRDINRMKLPNVREGSLMFFQKYCVYAIRKKMAESESGVVLANDPGLGKTRTILAALAEDEAAIFSPNSVVSAWDEEASECLIEPDLLVMSDIPHETRKELLRDRKHLRLVTNVQFLRKTNDAERFVLLSNGCSVVVHDEAHSRANEHSEQSKGAKMLHHKFQINVSATPFKNPKTLRRILHLLEPDDKRFSSDTAFGEAFPARDPEALKTLSLLKDKYTIRFRKQDVMEEVDPALHLSQQLHRLPRKEYVPPETIGQFEMSEDQAEAIYELFLNWSNWCRRYDKYMPDDEVAEEDHLRSGGNLTKRHALRQTINNPEYIGSNTEDAKAWQMQRIVKKCLREGRKVVIFCTYNAQTMKYAEMFKQYNPALYTGLTSNQGEKKNEEGEPMRFAREQIGKGKKRGWLFGPDGYPIENPKGETMPALDYERLSFQHAEDRQIIIATYQAGAVGTTFTAGKAMILDDLPADCIEAIQAEDRIHRIDPHHQTQATVKYYTMQSRYPQRFLDKMKKRWVRKLDDGTYEEVRNKREAEAENLQTAYDAFFAQGTLDQVHSQNLVTQKQMFHLINDGIADDSILKEVGSLETSGLT